MKNWSVSRRIYAGFGVMFALFAALAGISYFATVQIADVFTNYRSTARQTIGVNLLVEDLFQARMAALKYRIDPAEAQAKETADNINEIIAEEDKIERLFDAQSSSRAKLDEMSNSVDEYLEAFVKMRGLQAQRDVEVVKLVELGPKSRKQLTSIMESAHDDGDTEAAYYAGIAQQDLILGRFYTERYLLTNAEDAFKTASKHLTSATEKLTTLLGKLQNPGRRRLAQETIVDISRFIEVSASLHTIISNRNALREGVLDVLGPKIQNGYEEVAEAIVEEQHTLGPQGAETADNTMTLVAMVGVTSILIGAILALFVAKSVARSISGLANDMDALSNDNLDIDIKGADQNHELGQMARALVVFKDNAQKVRAMMEEQKQNAADANRRQEVMQSFYASLTSMVDRAVAGDFTARVATDFADDNLNNLAISINSMLEAVNAGLGETGRVLARVAEGDLRDRMNGAFQGSFAELQINMNETVEKLSSLFAEISETSGAVKLNADQISEGSVSLSSRTEQQASSLEETAATMEEMSASIKSNADSSAAASKLAADASGHAGKGGEIVGEAVSAMSEIEGSASKIADIISVIDGLSFQTNLLALNAAVEAARAGDAGKGFAVVASEVRALAQRSSEASRDIRELIETSASQVSQGVQLVNRTGDALHSIVDSIRQVEEAIGSIASASVEQASGVDEITTTISHMDEMTQQNASMAEQSASNAASMVTSAQTLGDLIAWFRFDGAGRGAHSSEAKSDDSWRRSEREAAKPSSVKPSPPKAAPAAPAPAPAPAEAAPAPAATAASGDWAEF